MDITPLDAGDDGAVIRTQSAAGLLTGVWRGRERAVVGERVDVELTFPRPRSWTELTPVGEAQPHSPRRGNMLRCRVEAALDFDGQIDENVVWLRIAGSIAMLEMSDEAPPGAYGLEYVLDAGDLEFCPTNT